MREAYPGHEVIEDIGSGINFRRKGLNALLERVLRGSVSEVVVAHRDRLARFGFDLIEWLCVRSGTRVVVLDGAVAEPQTKLCADLVSIITVFACRIQGRRRYVSKNPDLPDCRAAADSEAMVRGCALLVQPSDNPPKDSGNEGELEGNQDPSGARSAGVGEQCSVPSQERRYPRRLSGGEQREEEVQKD